MHVVREEEGMESAMEESAEGKDSEGPASSTVKLIYRGLCHVWSKDKKHLGFYTGQEVQAKIEAAFGHKVGVATVYRYQREEKELYASNDASAVRKPLDIVALINKTRDEKKEYEFLTMRTEPDKGMLHGSRAEFPPSWYPALQSRCKKLQKLLGFGPHIVQAFANLL